MTNGAVPFGTLANGAAVELFTLRSAAGVELQAMTYGGIIVSLRAPDRRGRLDDVVLGFGDLQSYVAGNSPYFGAVVGRYANRIANGRFVLDGRTVSLATNDGPNHLHGGTRGFHQALWAAEPLSSTGVEGVVFRRRSPDGEDGYPGALDVSVTYTLNGRNELTADYVAATDAPTPVNLTQHSYFNLAGQGAGNVLDHLLQIDAGRYTPVDETMIPTGELAPVAGTPFDFRAPRRIGDRIDSSHPQLARAGGYDHNWVLTGDAGRLRRAARLTEPSSGRSLTVSTTEPGLQFYSGNLLTGEICGKEGRPYTRRSGLCLETQHFPDSPNQPAFPSAILRPGAIYRSRTVFAFGVD